MAAQDNVAIVQAIFDSFNRGELDLATVYVDKDIDCDGQYFAHFLHFSHL